MSRSKVFCNPKWTNTPTSGYKSSGVIRREYRSIRHWTLIFVSFVILVSSITNHLTFKSTSDNLCTPLLCAPLVAPTRLLSSSFRLYKKAHVHCFPFHLHHFVHEVKAYHLRHHVQKIDVILPLGRSDQSPMITAWRTTLRLKLTFIIRGIKQKTMDLRCRVYQDSHCESTG